MIWSKQPGSRGLGGDRREFQVDDLDRLREMADGVRSRLSSGLVVLAAVVDEKVALVIMAAPDAMPEVFMPAG